MKNKIIATLITIAILLIVYIFLNIYYRENIVFNEFNLNNTEFKLEEKYNEAGINKYVYGSELGFKVIIYKLPAYVPPKGKPFSQEIKERYESLNYKNKRVSSLSDYHHHIFIIDKKEKMNEEEFNKYFNDYGTIIYCKANKNKYLHPKYITFAKNDFCFKN